jgi:hypothetical protein
MEVYLFIIDEDTVEFIFNTRNDKHLALIILKRYIQEFKNTDSRNTYIGESTIQFNKKCEIKKPVLSISDFYDKDDRTIKYDIEFK